MPERPDCIVNSATASRLERPRERCGDGVDWCLVPLSDVAGLTQMGVKIREVPPGRAGTHFHYHDVEEEWAYVLSGSGRLRIGPLTMPVRAGSFAAFPPGPRPHHFQAEGDAPLVLLEGGERRREQDTCTYPDLGLRFMNGQDEAIASGSLPAFGGDARQLVHRDDLEEVRRPHPLTPAAIRFQRGFDAHGGLQRQAIALVRIEPGVESTTFHTHDRTDEWVYLLAGEAELRLGHDTHVVRVGDFIAHPAAGPAHGMRAVSETTYLMGGESLPSDVVTYPELGMQLTSNGFEKIGTAD